MTIQRITFTEWTPDQPSIVENLSIAKNVIPAIVGYTPFNLAVDYSSDAGENLNQVYAGRFSNTTLVFAGGSTKLFKYNSATLALDNVSKTGNYTGVVKWNIVQFGNTIIAANNINKLQGFTIGSSSLFADLNASAPVAEYVTIVRDFVVAANLDSGVNANKVQWSNINDESDWSTGAASQSDFQIISDGGNIHGITGGETGLILLERAIVRMTYVGSPLFFQFDTISRSLGCIEGNSVVKYGNVTYFLGEKGFYSCDGSTITPIGNEKVDKWFSLNSNPSDLESISVAADSFRNIIVWNFANTFGGRSLLIYNWQVGKWSYGETDVNYVATSASAGLTLEVMDIFGNMDTIATSFDSRLFAGGKLLFAGARNQKIVTFTGASAEATITTGDIGNETASVINFVKPIVDNGSANIAVISRNKLNESYATLNYISADSENKVSVRSGGKYHRISIQPTGTQWSNVLAVDVDIIPQGNR